MAKIVKDDWEFKAEKIDNEMHYSAHYTVESEGIEQKRGMPIEFSPTEETQIFNFLKNKVRPKINEHEGLQ